MNRKSVARLVLLACCAVLVIPAGAAADDLFPSELVDFTAYNKNPVFSGTGNGTWDRKIRERGYILREAGRWHLWYTGYRTGGTRLLGYATSPDGLKWTRYSNKPLIDNSWIEDMHVVKYDDTYYMVAEGRHDIAHMLTSSDATNWKQLGKLDIRYTSGEPLSAGPRGTPTLWIEEDTWYLFYERRDLGVWLARSTDRKIWTNVQDDPVLKPGPEVYDKFAVALNQVIRHKGRFYGIYHANADARRKGPWTTNVAVSDDLVNWKKYPRNPIIPGNFSSGQWVHDGKGYRLYTTHPDVRAYFHRQRKTAGS